MKGEASRGKRIMGTLDWISEDFKTKRNSAGKMDMSDSVP